MRDRVLFDSWDHGWVVGDVSHLVPCDLIRISYFSPIDCSAMGENAFSNYPRIQHLPC